MRTAKSTLHQSNIMALAQAIVFVTHIEAPRIYHHFERLQRETRDVLDCFLCVHEETPRTRDSTRLQSDFRITSRDEAIAFPSRYSEKMQRGGVTIPGYTDLAYMPAALSSRLAAYKYIWFVEYDVDFAGYWKNLFAPLVQSRADLLGSTIFPRSECPGWHPWRQFQSPPEVSPRHYLRSFLPMFRFSRRMLNCYLEAVRDGAWRGHTEAIYPAIASHNGLVIEDYGGNGPFAHSSVRGKNYINSPTADGNLVPGTFIYRPVKHAAYFHEAPEQFTELGYLHHPVKVSID